MVERFEALLIAAGFRILGSKIDGESLSYRLESDEVIPFDITVRREFIDGAPENGLAFVRMAIERQNADGVPPAGRGDVNSG